MSKVKIQGHASGSGVLTITAPNTSTDRTITLPDTTGTLLDENSSVPAANLTGTVADARFPATLPAASAANLTAIPAANITGTLPAISGANLTNIDGGKVKQIKFMNSTTQVMHQSTTEADSGFTVSITPTSASSKIYCMFTSGCGNNDANKYLKVRLYRDSTAIAEIHTERGSYDYQMATIHYMDAPSTTSATTYKITVQSSASSHQGHLGINSTTTNLTVMEVDA
jgi:hypothetical protein